MSNLQCPEIQRAYEQIWTSTIRTSVKSSASRGAINSGPVNYNDYRRHYHDARAQMTLHPLINFSLVAAALLLTVIGTVLAQITFADYKAYYVATPAALILLSVTLYMGWRLWNGFPKWVKIPFAVLMAICALQIILVIVGAVARTVFSQSPDLRDSYRYWNFPQLRH